MSREKPFSEIESHRLVYANAHRIVTGIGRAALGVRVYGQENIPRQGGAIIAANHRHWLDVFTFPAAVPRRHVSMVAKHETFSTPVMGRFFEMWSALPIHREEPTLEEMRAIINRAKDGRLVALFPEETREKGRIKDRHEADLKEFQPGAAMIARRAKVPTVPAALYGMDHSLRA
jgi:1-acyl-sn-glycerol-3-phosphate acyltransferase